MISISTYGWFLLEVAFSRISRDLIIWMSGSSRKFSQGWRRSIDASPSTSTQPELVVEPALDPTILPTHNFVIDHYGNIGPMIQQYLGLFQWLKDQCSNGEETLWGVPLSNPNPIPLYCLLTVDVRVFHCPKTDIIVARKNVYVFAMTINGQWKEVSDCPFHIVGAERLPFSSSYQDLPGVVRSVGIGQLASALKMWNTPKGNYENHGVPFRNVLYNIPEVLRFKTGRSLIVTQLRVTKSIDASVTIVYPYTGLPNNWQLISNFLNDLVVVVKSRPNEMSKDDAKIKLWDTDKSLSRRLLMAWEFFCTPL